MEVYSDPKTATRIANRLDVAAAGDTTGRMVGTVSTNNGRSGVVGGIRHRQRHVASRAVDARNRYQGERTMGSRSPAESRPAQSP